MLVHRSVAALACALAVSGCGELVPVIDAGRSDAAADDARAQDAIVAPSDATPTDTATPPELTGRFLLGVAIANSPVAFEWTIADWWRAPDGSVRFVGTLRPLTRVGLSPTGVAHAVPASSATADGEVEFLVTDMAVPAAATGASVALVYTATYRADIVDGDRVCGTLPAGMITSPVQTSLVGLSWAAVRIPAGGPLPPLVTACP